MFNRVDRDVVLFVLFWIAMSFSLLAAESYDFLLFHFFVEIYTIGIALSIYLITSNARAHLRNNFILLMGIAFIFIAGLDLLHTLSYKGTGLFEAYGTNLATQLWIAGRYIQGMSFLAGLYLMCHKKVDLRSYRQHDAVFAVYALIFSVIIITIFFLEVYPTCYIEGEGLTPFKIYSEYVISLIFGIGIAMLYQRRRLFDRPVYIPLIAFLLLSIMSELAFTTYVGVYGPANMVGHFLKLYAFVALYRAIIVPVASNPMKLLIQDLKQSKMDLKNEQMMAKQYLDIAGVMIVAYEPDGTITLANNKTCEILGYEKDELVGKNWFNEFTPVDVRDELKYVFYELSQGNKDKVKYRENKIITKGGDVRHVAWYNEVLKNNESETVGIISSGEDITARKAAEKEVYYRLRLEEVISNISRTLMKPAKDIDLIDVLHQIGEATSADRTYIFLYDKNSRTMNNTHEWTAPGVSSEIETLQGLRMEDFRWWCDQLDKHSYINRPNVGEIEDPDVRKILEAQNISSILAIELLCVDGSSIGFLGFDSLETKIWRPEDIRLINTLAEMISLYFKRVKDQELLIASERKFRGLVQKSCEITLLVDATCTIRYCSSSISNILGYDAEKVIGSCLSKYFKNPMNMSPEMLADCEEPYSTLETKLTDKNGNERDFELSINNMLEDDDIAGIVINARDITARKQAQMELEKRNRELEEFTRKLYHDMQTPLVTIGSYADEIIADLAKGDISSVKTNSFVIRNAARQLSAYATDLAVRIRIRK